MLKVLLDLFGNSLNMAEGVFGKRPSPLSPQCPALCRHGRGVLLRPRCRSPLSPCIRKGSPPHDAVLTPLTLPLSVPAGPNPSRAPLSAAARLCRRTVPTPPTAPAPSDAATGSASTSSLCWTRPYPSGVAGPTESVHPSPLRPPQSKHRRLAGRPPRPSPSAPLYSWWASGPPGHAPAPPPPLCRFLPERHRPPPPLGSPAQLRRPFGPSAASPVLPSPPSSC